MKVVDNKVMSLPQKFENFLTSGLRVMIKIYPLWTPNFPG